MKMKSAYLLMLQVQESKICLLCLVFTKHLGVFRIVFVFPLLCLCTLFKVEVIVIKYTI